MADTNNVYTANPTAAGTFYRAVRGTTPPTDGVSTLASAFKDHGYVGEEGYSYMMTRDSSDVQAFGGDDVASPQKGYKEELKVTCIEASNAEVLRTVFGDANVVVAQDGSIKVTRNKAVLPRSVYVIDTEGQDGGSRRLVIPNGMITTVGDIKYVHSDIIKYELTIKAYPDLSGNPSYEYIEPTELGS